MLSRLHARLRKLLGLRSPRWSAVRKKFLAANPDCAACGSKKRLEVHHVLPFRLWPALELMPTNLITLCHSHHFVMGHFNDWEKYNPSVREDAAAWRKKIGSA